MRRCLQAGLLVLCAAGLAGPGAAQVQFGGPAPDFPPGAATDGGTYRLADFAGKVVVLYFFEKQ